MTRSKKKAAEKTPKSPVQKSLVRRFESFIRETLNTSKPIDEFDAEASTDHLLLDAIKGRASDLHLDPWPNEVRIRLRIDGELIDAASLSLHDGHKVINHFKALAGLDPVHNFRPHDARVHTVVQGHDVDLRMATAPTHFGEKLSIRILDQENVCRSILDLGLEESDMNVLRKWIHEINGMCLIAGPTGAGKTTTLYALLNELRLRNRSIISIEDPIEYQVDGVTQIQVDNRHGLDFADGIRSILRLDPDYMIVGEIRDPGSGMAAIKASSCGHVVMSTLHSRDTAGVVTSLRNWNVEQHQIAANMSLVIAQRLVRRLCVKCRKSGRPDTVQRQWLKDAGLAVPTKIWNPGGCRHCHQTGYNGRIGVFEIWHKEEADLNLILDGAPESALRQHLQQQGCRSVLMDGMNKVKKGITSIYELQQFGELYRLRITNPVKGSASASRRSGTRNNGKPAAKSSSTTPRKRKG